MNVITDAIDGILSKKNKAIIAIDGRCASGKTTLAENLSRKYDAAVIHMDDFFLQPYQRTKERLDTPGGNFDRERFEREVLIPLSSGKRFSFRPFVCKTMSFGEMIHIEENRLVIIEGSYSCHPDLYDYYDLHIFSDIDNSIQYERLLRRNPDRISDFKEKWIPMEEKYFDYYDIKNKCEIIYKGE